MPVSQGRSKGHLVLTEGHRLLGALDITRFSLLLPVVGLPPEFMLKIMGVQALVGR